jgi:hypothetical protein
MTLFGKKVFVYIIKLTISSCDHPGVRVTSESSDRCSHKRKNKDLEDVKQKEKKVQRKGQRLE